MKVLEILDKGNIIPGLDAKNKTEAIEKIIEVLKNNPQILNFDKAKAAVIEREKIMSTGVGKGFAIPHGKTNAVNDIVGVFARLNNPIDYDSLDGAPVNLIFLLIGNDQLVSKHIKLLSRISRMMNNDQLRNKLLSAKNEDEIYNILKEEEKSYLEI